MRFFVIKMKYVILSAVVFVALGCVAFIVGNTVEDVGNMQKEVPIYCVETDEKKIAITFDCAWNADDVDSIIETLKKYDCKATFFVVGDWLERFPDEVKKLSDNGHEIANHSYGHGHFNSMSKEQMLSDMQKCDDKIKEVTGIAPTLFRAPYGEYNDLLIKTCRESGRIYIQWSVDSLDWKDISEQEIYDRCIKKSKSGDILLLHNGTPYTAKVLPRILEELAKEYKFVKVSDMIYKDNYTVDITGCQRKNK